MEEKRNYVVYTSNCCGVMEEVEHVIKMSEAQAEAIRWFMNIYDIDGCVELAEKYEGMEI